MRRVITAIAEKHQFPLDEFLSAADRRELLLEQEGLPRLSIQTLEPHLLAVEYQYNWRNSGCNVCFYVEDGDWYPYLGDVTGPRMEVYGMPSGNPLRLHIMDMAGQEKFAGECEAWAALLETEQWDKSAKAVDSN